MEYKLKPCWLNCYAPDDKRFLEDKELPAIDAMEDAIVPLDDRTRVIRQLITRFELCYHEADKETECIIEAIGSGRPPTESGERPLKRKQELQNCRAILSAWSGDSFNKVKDIDVGGIPANKLVSFIGERNPLKVWQVERIIDRVTEALEPNRRYYRLALDLGDYGEPGAVSAGDHYKDNSVFLEQTKQTIIHDTIDGRKSKVSLAMAIDMMMPCHWDFVGALVIILKAIGGNLHPDKPFACCSRNIKLGPLCERMEAISDTLQVFWKGEETVKDIDLDIISILGEPTPEKRWLAASLDKTIRLQLSLPFEVDLS